MKRREFLANTSLFLSTFSLPKFVEFDSTPLLTKTITNSQITLILYQKNSIIAESLIFNLKKKFQNLNFLFISPNEAHPASEYIKNVDRNKKTIVFYEKESNLDLDDTLLNSISIESLCDSVFCLNVKRLTLLKSRSDFNGRFTNLHCFGSLIRVGRDSYYYTDIEER
jgi:hypothetical protein